MSIERLNPEESQQFRKEWEINMPKKELARPVRTLGQLEQDCEGDPTLQKLFESMRDFLYRYVETVMEYQRIVGKGFNDEATAKALVEMEPKRTRIHNGMMDAVNIFSRNLAKAGLDNQWIANMVGARAKYARFAMQAVYENEKRLDEPTVQAAA